VVSVSQAARANRARALAEQREAEARENLWASYLAAARASRTSAQPGRRFGALEAVAKASAIRPSPELRSEAASAMALVDVRTVREWEGLLPKTTGVVLDHRFERYARNNDEQGHISVRRVSDDREWLTLEGKFAPVRFSPDGRFLLGTDCHPPRFAVWNLDTGQRVVESPMSGYCPGPDFHPHAPVLAACGTGGTVEFFDLAAGERRSWPATNIPPGSVRFRPDGVQMALSSLDPPGVRVYAVESGELVVSLAHTNAVRCVDWSADGRWLAAPCADGRVYLWNMREGGTLDRVLDGHDEVVSGVCFDPQGEFLVSRSWDGTTVLWSLASHGLVLRLPGSDYPLAFSGDGRWLGPYVAGPIVNLLELERAPEHRVLPADTGEECNAAFSPDGRWVVVGGDGVQCWDPPTGQRLWTESVGHVRYVAFRPDSGMLLTLSETGGREWPWLTDTASGHPRLGSPRRLTESWGSQAEYSGDGSVLVIAQRDGLWVSDSRALTPKVLPMPMCTFAAVSPDGQWAAGTSWGGMGMKVWELPTGREVFHLTHAFPTMGFTRDGRWLVVAREDVFQCLEVGTWRPAGDVSHQRPRVFAHALPANSRWVAVEQGRRGHVQFCELPTLRPFLTLETAGGFPLCFSPDDRLLLTRRGSGQFGLWNLHRIRNALAPQGLDW
jgi:WD40 repeat protein